MVSKVTGLALCLSTSVFAMTAYAADKSPVSAPVTEIMLSSGGLAEINRRVEVNDNAVVTLTVPLDQVDDVLKSLTIRDPNSSGGSASLAGKQPLTEAFRNLPFSAEDIFSQVRLLGALQGASVTISGGGRNISGLIAGVESFTVPAEKGPPATKHRLNIVNDGKLTAFDLDQAEITFNDPALRAQLAGALNVIRTTRAGDARDIDIDIKGTGKRSVSIGYVVPAPIWKTTYRLTLPKEGDKAEMEGWAIIENTSSDDWKDVRLSLTSGSPVTLRQRLHEAYFAQRPEVAIYGPNGILPLTDKGASAVENTLSSALHQIRPSQFAERRVSAKELAAPVAASPAAEPPMPFNLARMRIAAADTLEADVSTSFSLPIPVSLEKGRSLTLPFLNVKMTANRVSVFQPQLGIGHPVAAVMVRNESPSSLPPGILTLTEEGSGYAGDAQLAGLPSGESRFITFATDRKVQITSDTSNDGHILSIKAIDGSLKLSRSVRSVTTYKIRGAADADRTIIVEHPRMAGLSYSGRFNDTETPTAIRMKLDVKKGETVEASIVGERKLEEVFALRDPEQAAQAIVITSPQTSDPVLAAKIAEVAEAAADIAGKTEAIAGFDDETGRIKDDQERIRENLKAIPANSDLARTYLATLTAQEKRLAETDALRLKAEDTLKAARAVLTKKLQAF